MANNKKPRKQYKPKVIFSNPVGHILQGFSLVRELHKDQLLGAQIMVHNAMRNVTHGDGTAQDYKVLVQALNTSDALFAINGIGVEHLKIIRDGQDALLQSGRRLSKNKQVTLYAHEMTALNAAIDLHDEQMANCTLLEYEKAVDLIDYKIRSKQATNIC